MLWRYRLWPLAAAFLVTLSGTAHAQARSSAALAPPVDAVIARYFDDPASPYGPGHRGIDYAVAAGTRVRAAGDGVVSWAGSVAGNLSVTIDHGSGLETTYSMLASLEVTRGEAVDEGRFLGTAGRDHDGASAGLHFGVKLHDDYVDPLDHLGPVGLGDAIHLAPLVEETAPEVPHVARLAFEGAGAHVRPCRDPGSPGRTAPPPNDNVAVAVAGLSSNTIGKTNAAIYEEHNGPAGLGYPAKRIYRFSYRGVEGPRLHEPYEASDTWTDIDKSGRRLAALLRAIHERHPRAEVDLFAHSQGGLVARAYLERLAGAYDPRLPRVEHLVTYGTPHRGTPLAGVAGELDEHTLTGRFVVDRLSEWAREDGPALDPRAPSVSQMEPGSDFLAELAREDVVFGTRVLSLAMPHDIVVPAESALYPGKEARVLSPRGVNGHEAVVVADEARALAYSFLRDAPVSCRGAWDEWGRVVGRGIGFVHGLMDDAYRHLETFGVTKAATLVGRAAKAAWSGVKWAGRGLKRVGSDAVRAGG
ncbi:MAG TPA: peptidoglycan DD-metalloendopeptidase family protein, partial [Actinomycetota bacterium]|nr:peptidoglycan DD-metalloendopeptidase family protein [Actinomycetota bacterium]